MRRQRPSQLRLLLLVRLVVALQRQLQQGTPLALLRGLATPLQLQRRVSTMLHQPRLPLLGWLRKLRLPLVNPPTRRLQQVAQLALL